MRIAVAKVFVLPSHSEVMPQVLYQAAQAGTSIIVSKNIHVDSCIQKYVSKANPKKPKQFRKLVQESMNTKPNHDLRKAALSMPTWQDISDRILSIYNEVLTSTLNSNLQ